MGRILARYKESYFYSYFPFTVSASNWLTKLHLIDASYKLWCFLCMVFIKNIFPLQHVFCTSLNRMFDTISHEIFWIYKTSCTNKSQILIRKKWKKYARKIGAYLHDDGEGLEARGWIGAGLGRVQRAVFKMSETSFTLPKFFSWK